MNECEAGKTFIVNSVFCILHYFICEKRERFNMRERERVKGCERDARNEINAREDRGTREMRKVERQERGVIAERE